MSLRALHRGLVAAAALTVAFCLTASAFAQGVYYREIEKDGRIYVFSSGARADLFAKSGEIGVAITRIAAGPNGETLVFENEDAINLYNFKHNLPGEYFPKPAEKPKKFAPSGKIIGLAFGDYYFVADHHDAAIKDADQHGFWLRRAYLGWDQTFSPTVSARLRLEMNSNGKFAGGNINPYLKDAYATWKFHGKQQARLGIAPTLTFDSEESFWGLRHIEKTPADLYKIDSSRDFALTLSGPLGTEGLSYAAQVGNDSGNGSEKDKYKAVRFLGLYEPKLGLRLEGVFNFQAQPDKKDRLTAKGLVGFKNPAFRLAGEFLWQKRKSGEDATPDTTIQILSAFGVWDFKPKKGSVFARFDDVRGKLDGETVGLPGADGIDYLVLSKDSAFRNVIVGLEWYLTSSVRLSPNVEWVSYDDSATKDDVIPRVTFYWTW